jgi:TetR/AcrR family transcriptional regulator, cholesterol catabolism regulator
MYTIAHVLSAFGEERRWCFAMRPPHDEGGHLDTTTAPWIIFDRVGPALAGGYDSEQTRQSIVDSALSLFERQGFDGTSVQQVTTQAGLTTGAFYYHFKSKLEVLLHIQDEYVDAQLEAINHTVLPEKDPRRRIEQIVRCALRTAVDNRARMSVFQQERRFLNRDAFAEVRAKRDTVESVFLSTVKDGMAAGIFDRRFDPQIVTFGIFGICDWAFQWCETGGRLSADDVADQFCAMVFDGLLAAGPTPADD